MEIHRYSDPNEKKNEEDVGKDKYHLAVIDKNKGRLYFWKELDIYWIKRLKGKELEYIKIIEPPLPDVLVEYENKEQFLERIEKIETINKELLELKSSISQPYDARVIFVRSKDVYLHGENVRESLEEISKAVCLKTKIDDLFSCMDL